MRKETNHPLLVTVDEGLTPCAPDRDCRMWGTGQLILEETNARAVLTAAGCQVCPMTIAVGLSGRVFSSLDRLDPGELTEDKIERETQRAEMGLAGTLNEAEKYFGGLFGE